MATTKSGDYFAQSRCSRFEFATTLRRELVERGVRRVRQRIVTGAENTHSVRLELGRELLVLQFTDEELRQSCGELTMRECMACHAQFVQRIDAGLDVA